MRILAIGWWTTDRFTTDPGSHWPSKIGAPALPSLRGYTVLDAVLMVCAVQCRELALPTG